MLILSGALGWHVGAGAFADWQVAVESAQVVARLVEYPPGNPFYVYHTKLWTILHQGLAVLLAAGLSERTLSVAVSGLLGMVSFQALSLTVYALSRDVLIAAGASALIFFTRVAEANAIYPIWLVGTSHTYGVIALSYCALVVGFLGCGWYRTGLFLLGLAPAVHPSLGAWLILVGAIVFASDWRRLCDRASPRAAGIPRRLRRHARRAWRFSCCSSPICRPRIRRRRRSISRPSCRSGTCTGSR